MEYERCYVFRPEGSRPKKRRRIEEKGLQSSWPQRRQIYQQAWQTLEADIDARLTAINVATNDEVVEYLDSFVDKETQKTPAGFLLAGPNSTLFSSLALRFTKDAGVRRIFVPVSSNAATNLKGVLKTIIRQATLQTHEDDEDEAEEISATRKGTRLLNYDLQILHSYAREHDTKQVVLAFEDTEGFDGHILSELIEILHCWQARIPFALLFNIATSIEFLQQRLSQSAIRCLIGRAFDSALVSDEVEQVFEAVISPRNSLSIGPGLASMILERQRGYTQGIESMVDAIHYAYMSSYYANALSIFMGEVAFEDVTKDHFEAIRNTKSFQAFAARLLEDNETARLCSLLESDQALNDMVKEAVRDGQQAVAQMVHATEVVRNIQRCLSDTQESSKINLYIQAMSGKLNGSPLLRNLLLSTRKVPSNVILELMRRLVSLDIPQAVKDQGIEIYDQLFKLVGDQTESSQPLRSDLDIHSSTFRTTVVAQKVALSKQKAALSKQDAAYSSLLRQFTDLLESYFNDTLIDTGDLLMHEIFIYDFKSPHREVFTPRPRHAVERALTAPHDYLDCDCCAAEAEQGEGTLAASQPATAILYQLYLESGSLINVSDLWQAYNAIVADDNEQRTMAMFQRALAELRYLGIVKSTRRRVDHIAKVAWKGL